MVTFVEQNLIKLESNSNFSIFPIQVPRVKLRFEVLLKRFHLFIYLFLTNGFIFNWSLFNIKKSPVESRRSLVEVVNW
jgi:hypothetical protein